MKILQRFKYQDFVIDDNRGARGPRTLYDQLSDTVRLPDIKLLELKGCCIST